MELHDIVMRKFKNYKNLNHYAQTQQEEHNFSKSSIHALSQNSQVNPASISGDDLEGQVRWRESRWKLRCNAWWAVSPCSVHGVGERSSVQLHVEQLRDRAEVIPAIHLLRAHPPQGRAGATWEMALLGTGGTSFPVYPEEAPQLEAAKDFSLPWLFDGREKVPGSWLLTGSCVTSLSLLRGKEGKITSHRTITGTDTFVKSRNTEILQNTV